jgi:hypothetical protein
LKKDLVEKQRSTMVLIGSSKALVALLSGFLLAISSGIVEAQFSSNVVALTARNWRQEVEGRLR